jgi:hypothetical protein
MPRTNSSSRQSTYKPSSISKPSSQPQIIQHKLEQPSFMSNIFQGLAWGTGTSIARNIFESKPTPTVYESTKVVEKNDCDVYKFCLKMDDKYDCFNKMDQKEYEKCKQIL